MEKKRQDEQKKIWQNGKEKEIKQDRQQMR